MEKDDDKIFIDTVDCGIMFEGTRLQFCDAFFSNAYDEVIEEWCKENQLTLTINDRVIIDYEFYSKQA